MVASPNVEFVSHEAVIQSFQCPQSFQVVNEGEIARQAWVYFRGLITRQVKDWLLSPHIFQKGS